VRRRIERWLNARWYEGVAPDLGLRMLACLHAWLGVLRRRALKHRAWRAPVPVVVIGNLSAGGTGKSPLVAWLAARLQDRGLRPGLVSRGYRGRTGRVPLMVTPAAGAREIGDEAVMLARQTGVPMVVGSDRPAACRHLLRNAEIDIILSDDGLQHYRLARDIEVAVLDRDRGLGNRRLIPAGPLREPPARLQEVDFRVWNGGVPTGEEGIGMRVRCRRAVRLTDGHVRPLDDFRGGKLHAVAGIGVPERFFAALEAAGLDILRYAPGDHADEPMADVPEDGLPVLMTDKDAVKSASPNERYWRVPAEVEVEGGERLVDEAVRRCRRGPSEK
jgi:tetraacyldisaccharide 4'-kinase